MKYLFILIFVLLSGFHLSAQAFSGGLLLGVCGSQVDGDEQSGYKKPGLLAGAWVSKPISKYTDLKIETYYIGKGAVLNIEHEDGTLERVFNTSFHYVEIPFLWNLNFGDKIDMALGIAPSYLFAHKITGQYYNDVQEADMTNFDFQGMTQVDFFLTEKISSSIRFSYSIFDIRKEPMSTWRNNNLSIAFRYKIR